MRAGDLLDPETLYYDTPCSAMPIVWLTAFCPGRLVSLGYLGDDPLMSQNKLPTSNEDGVARAAGRPRSDASHRAILEAAHAILVETGLKSFSIEAVASRAGVARTTIYRWWPDKSMLVNESFLNAFQPQINFTRTDSPSDDFRSFLASLAKALSGPDGRIAASVVAQAQSDPETQRMFLEEFSTPLRRHSAALLQAGINRGQFRPDLNVSRVLDAAIGAVYLRLLLGQTLGRSWVREMADTILHGCYADKPGQAEGGTVRSRPAE